ncbi:hypothetical protein D3C76_1670070 [compost metagenome]
MIEGRGFAVAFYRVGDVDSAQRFAQGGLGAAFHQRVQIHAQIVGVDFLQFGGASDHHPAQLIVIEQGLQQMAGADLRLAELD